MQRAPLSLKIVHLNLGQSEKTNAQIQTAGGRHFAP